MLAAYPDSQVLNYDKLTYCGNPANLAEVASHPGYQFAQGDIADPKKVREVFSGFRPEVVVNFAAETHVDRSILDPSAFAQTDVIGTLTLLQAIREFPVERYIQISTDEVYGPVAEGESDEETPFRPSSPYAASKAGADHLVAAFSTTYRLPVITTHAANNYGPHQYPEKFIPLFITNLLDGQRVPVYGSGQNVREWLFVRDHSRAVDALIRSGELGQSYNIGSGVRKTNLEVTLELLKLLNRDEGSIEHVEDRLGHDVRYAVQAAKLRGLGWKTDMEFSEGLKQTVEWYQGHRSWWEPLKSGAYREYYEKQYGSRSSLSPAGS
jgi:dTDP-glucose 4,6-dehydratase